MRRGRRVALALLLAASAPGAQSANRVLHEAWFALAVEEDAAGARVRLAELLARPDLGPGWRARALELDARCRALLEPPLPLHGSRAPGSAEGWPTPVPPVSSMPDAQPALTPSHDSWLDLFLVPPADLPAAPAVEKVELEELVLALDNRAARWRARLPAGERGGVLALIARRFALERGTPKDRAYELATASFEHGLRDDPERQKTRNDWDLQFGNGSDRFHVNMTGGDRSTITVLPASPDAPTTDSVSARVRKSYRVHTLDSDTDLTFEFLVLEHEPNRWVILAWQPVVR
jgi:hypothetical protein